MKLFRIALVMALIFLAVAPAQAGKMLKSKEPLAVEPGKAVFGFMRPG